MPCIFGYTVAANGEGRRALDAPTTDRTAGQQVLDICSHVAASAGWPANADGCSCSRSAPNGWALARSRLGVRPAEHPNKQIEHRRDCLQAPFQ